MQGIEGIANEVWLDEVEEYGRIWDQFASRTQTWNRSGEGTMKEVRVLVGQWAEERDDACEKLAYGLQERLASDSPDPTPAGAILRGLQEGYVSLRHPGEDFRYRDTRVQQHENYKSLTALRDGDGECLSRAEFEDLRTDLYWIHHNNEYKREWRTLEVEHLLSEEQGDLINRLLISSKVFADLSSLHDDMIGDVPRQRGLRDMDQEAFLAYIRSEGIRVGSRSIDEVEAIIADGRKAESEAECIKYSQRAHAFWDTAGWPRYTKLEGFRHLVKLVPGPDGHHTPYKLEDAPDGYGIVVDEEDVELYVDGRSP